MPASVTWRNTPLGPAAHRLAASYSVPLWIDRRVDRQQRLTITARDQPLGDLLAAIASDRGLGVAFLNDLAYVGPSDSAEQLPALAAAWPADAPSRLKRRGDTAWPRLTRPRELAESIVAEAGYRLANADVIPHDLWPAGELADIATGDQLMLVLVGFDLRWRVESTRTKTLRVEPIDDDQLAAVLPETKRGKDRPPSPIATEQRFTLRVIEQPIGAVLRQLAEQIGLELKLEVDPASLDERRISFQVDQATLEELFAAIAAAARLEIQVEQDRVRVRAKPREPSDASPR